MLKEMCSIKGKSFVHDSFSSPREAWARYNYYMDIFVPMSLRIAEPESY